jgi:uncharacterized membrane protein YeiH
MNYRNSNVARIIIAALLGALGGGIVVAIITRAIPRMVAYITAAVLQKIAEVMKESGVDEMFHKMMATVEETPAKK